MPSRIMNEWWNYRVRTGHKLDWFEVGKGGVFPNWAIRWTFILPPHSDDQGQQNYERNNFEILEKHCPRTNLPWHFQSSSCGQISWGFHRLSPRKAFCTSCQSLSLGFGLMGCRSLWSGSIQRAVRFWVHRHPQGWKGSAKSNENWAWMNGCDKSKELELGEESHTKGDRPAGSCGGCSRNAKSRTERRHRGLFRRKLQPQPQRTDRSRLAAGSTLLVQGTVHTTTGRRCWDFIPVLRVRWYLSLCPSVFWAVRWLS